MLEGLPELQQLNLYGNKVSLIVIPTNPKLLSKLELLNLGYNDLAFIPEELDTLKSLKTLKMMNNFVEKIPMRVCDMKQLATIDVSSNPVIQPPIETCERGICSMRRYYECLRVEEQSKQKALERLQNKAAHHQHRKSSAKKAVMEKMKGLTKPMFTLQTSLGRKHSEDSSSRTSNDQSSLASLASSKEIQSISHAPKYGFSPASRGHPFLGGRSSGTSGEQPSPKADVKMPPQDRSVPATTTRSDSGGKQTTEEVPNSVSVEDVVSVDESNGTRSISAMSETSYSEYLPPADQVSVNDTLKVIFVGMAMAGKTSMIKRLIEGEGAKIPTRDERTIGVDIYEWDPKKDHRFEHIDSRIELQDKELEETCGDVDVKFSVWDFAGQHVYHATHELFFSQRALFVLVWDMGATNPSTIKQRNVADDSDQGAFKLSYDSSDEEEDKDDDFVFEEEARRADRALDRDIDEKVQFWVDCIQSSAPGAAILPVASFDDKFSDNNFEEAKRRCNIMKQRLLKHEERRLRGIKARLKEYEDKNRANDQGALRLRKLLSPYARPKLIFGDTLEDSVVRVSGLEYTGFAPLTERIINIATGRDKGKQKYPIFRGHVGARIPRMRLEVRDTVRAMRERFKVVEWGYFINQLRDKGLHSVEDISDALHFLTNIGELSYFGGVLPDRDTVALVSDDQSVST
jgi:GTPase SAR1 family protein